MSDLFPCGLMVSEVISRDVSYANGYLYKLIGREPGTDAVDLLEQVFTKASLIFIDSYLYPMLLAEGKCDERLLTVRHVNGSRIPVVVNLELKDENCAAWSIIPAVERDTLYQELLTAREALEQHADHLQDDLKRLTSEADIGYADVSLTSGRVRCNMSFFKHHNWSDDTREIRLDEMYSSYTQEYARILPKVIERVVDSGVEQRITLEVDTNTGASRFLEMRAYLARTDTDVPILRLVTIDVTQRAVMQREIEDAEREAQESLASLLRTQKKQNQVYGMIAHELRTPVAMVAMMANDTESDFGSHQGSIRQACKDLLATIDDMSLLINPDLKRPIRPEAFTVKDLNATVASSVASIVASTGVQYQQYNAIALPLVDDEFSADTYRVRVVITNLVKNACLHSRGTHVWMFSRMAMDSQGGEYLEWVIGDDGIGIPEAQIDGLFKAGVRGDSEAEGTGFGLYIAKNWIEEINGSIRYRPRKKGGSEFIVRLPLVPADGQTATTVDQAPEIHTKLEDFLPKLNVLIAEDEVMLRMLAQKLLSRMVGTIKAAQHGREGLEQFDSTINLVLTDYFMPEMSGVEFAKQLRQQGYTGVILGITAATIGEQRQDLLDAGVDMVLPKPLNAEMFRNSISQLISEGRFEDLLDDEGAADACDRINCD